MKHLTLLFLLLGSFCFGQSSYSWDGSTLTYNGVDYTPQGLVAFTTGTRVAASQGNIDFYRGDYGLQNHHWFGFNAPTGSGSGDINVWSNFTEHISWGLEIDGTRSGNNITGSTGTFTRDIPTGDVGLSVRAGDDDWGPYVSPSVELSYTTAGRVAFFSRSNGTSLGNIKVTLTRNVNRIGLEISGPGVSTTSDYRWTITPNGGSPQPRVTGQTIEQFVTALNTLSGGDIINFTMRTTHSSGSWIPSFPNGGGMTATIPASVRN